MRASPVAVLHFTNKHTLRGFGVLGFWGFRVCYHMGRDYVIFRS